MSLSEESKGLWANIRAKRARGEKPAPKGSEEYNKAVAAAKKINADEEVTICEKCAVALLEDIKAGLFEAEYQGRDVALNKPMRGDVKKFKVFVKDPKSGNIKKVNFGHGGTSAKRRGEKTMKIKKNIPSRRKSFRARHNCDNPGPRTKARYWACRTW